MKMKRLNIVRITCVLALASVAGTALATSATADAASAASTVLTAATASAESPGVDKRVAAGGREPSRFVAHEASMTVLLDALSGGLHRPIVASDKVRRKRVTGEFDLTRPRRLLATLSASLSLLWYDDGASIYVYDNSEIKNALISMQHATAQDLRDFLSQARLSDPAFPVRGDGAGSVCYVAGAPVYVNLVVAAARYLDSIRASGGADDQVVRVVPLHNSFVVDRQFMLRDRPVDIPGMATVLGRVFGRSGNIPAVAAPTLAVAAPPQTGPASGAAASNALFSPSLPLPAPFSSGATSAAAGAAHEPATPAPGIVLPSADGVRAIANPETNSVVLVGSRDKVRDTESLIRSLDVAKRQIELSLWIIDIKKSRLDQLGVDWQGALSAPGLGIGLNTAGSDTATLDGARFLASVRALGQTGDATIVSRPIVLTQENVPAIFDSYRTFYARLVGERTAQLEHVSYGTLVSVLPRLSGDASKVEMVVNIEDGNADGATKDGQITVSDNSMPVVNRTVINTVARVPSDKSLLIGGNTHDDVTRHTYRIPGLANIPLIGGLFRGHSERHEQVARVFLIQPKLLTADTSWDGGSAWEPGGVAANPALAATVQMLQHYIKAAQ